MISCKVKNTNIVLDIVRILSAIAIFINHSGYISNDYKIVSLGLHGVDFFFVMSGYFIFCSMERNEKYGQYIKRRFLRIMPAYFVILLFIIIWKSVILQNMPEDYLYLGWLRYILCIQTIVPSNDFVWNNIYGLWTIPSFIFFYLIAPIIKKIVKESPHRVLIFMLCCMMWCLISQNIGMRFFSFFSFEVDKADVLIGSSPLNCLYLFCPGIMAYCILKGSKEKQGIGIIYIVIFIIFGQIIGNEKIIWACYMALIVVASEMLTSEQSFASSRFICFLARISFPFYLCHMLILDIINYTFKTEITVRYISIVAIVLFSIFIELASTKISRIISIIGRKNTKEVQ